MSADPFKKAEDEFARLRGDLIGGRLTLDQFHNALKQGKIRDSLGREWAIGAETGKWYVRENGRWVQSNPYPVEPLPDESSGIQAESLAPASAQTSPPQEIATTPDSPPAVEPATAAPNLAALSTTFPAQPPIPSPLESIQAPQPDLGAQLPTISRPPGRGQSRTLLYLLVLVLGMCAILLALLAIAVVLASSRGLF